MDLEELGIWLASVPGAWPSDEWQEVSLRAGETPVRVNMRPKPFFHEEVTQQTRFVMEEGIGRKPLLSYAVRPTTGQEGV